MPAPREEGFTLIEALIAMLVLAFGMLAIAGLQTTLAHNSDVAKQRTEATRLAQAKLEQLRAFQQLPAASGVAAYADIASGSDTPAAVSNTTYERSWTVADDTGATHKTLLVHVRWTDRQQDPADAGGERQSVTLASVIARTDPRAAGALALQPAPSQTRKPSYGMPPIPSVARYIGEGRSAIQLPRGGAYIVYSNAANAVVNRCAGTVTAATDASNVCADPLSAFLVTGFISGLPAAAFRGQPAGFNDDAQAAALDLALEPGYTAGGPAECQVARVPAGGSFPREPGSPAPTAFVSTFYAYVCLIRPGADGQWSGRLRLAPGAGSLVQTNDRICRLSWDQDGSGAIDINREHPDTYVRVAETLQGQNFLYVPRVDAATPAPCPADATVNGVAVRYAELQLIP